MLAHLQDGQLAGARILAPGTTRRMQATQFTAHPRLPGVTYGFFEDDHSDLRVINHEGTLPGTTALMTLVPELDLGIFAVSNLSADGCEAVFDLPDAVLDRFYPRPAVPPTTRPASDFDAQARRIAGNYRSVRRTCTQPHTRRRTSCSSAAACS